MIHESQDTLSAVQPPLESAKFVGVDLDPSRRPGVPRMHAPEKLPNARHPPTRMQSDVTVFIHGRAHQDSPPVFGTDSPPTGLSGQLRKAAYAYPDHVMRHWMMLRFADRVDVWEHRAGRLLKIGVPLLALGWAASALKKKPRGFPRGFEWS